MVGGLVEWDVMFAGVRRQLCAEGVVSKKGNSPWRCCLRVALSEDMAGVRSVETSLQAPRKEGGTRCVRG